jgi:hypothetical protein
MTWHHLSANWDLLAGKLQSRFPLMEIRNWDSPPRDRGALTRHLADMHDLTLEEAQEELEYFLSLEMLASQAVDFFD